jgi:NIPSNAP
MIVEQRIYKLHPGKVPEFLRLYETTGLEVHRRILGNLIGYFTTATGKLNHVVHFWGFDNLEDRARRRAELVADPTWQACAATLTPLLIEQESWILTPTSFSPMQ